MMYAQKHGDGRTQYEFDDRTSRHKQHADETGAGKYFSSGMAAYSHAGVLVNVIIPQLHIDKEHISGVGKASFCFPSAVFLEYANADGCANAKSMLGGRKLCSNAVSAAYYPDDQYYSADYSGYKELRNGFFQ
ncbi:hypothetical protein Ancab_033817 [Ancistrocladus abbreviatus]